MQLDDGRLSLGSPGMGPAVQVGNCFAAVPKNHSTPLPKKTKRPENQFAVKREVQNGNIPNHQVFLATKPAVVHGNTTHNKSSL